MNEVASGCTGEGAYLGDPGNAGKDLQGIYFLRTNGNSPFGLGQF
jgi:hypothetical protein